MPPTAYILLNYHCKNVYLCRMKNSHQSLQDSITFHGFDCFPLSLWWLFCFSNYLGFCCKSPWSLLTTLHVTHLSAFLNGSCFGLQPIVEEKKEPLVTVDDETMISLYFLPRRRNWILSPEGQVLHNEMTGWDAYHTHGSDTLALFHPVPPSIKPHVWAD